MDVKEKKLCLKVARLCTKGRIRSLHPITNPYNAESFVAEIEVGDSKDWEENHRRSYLGGNSTLL